MSVYPDVKGLGLEDVMNCGGVGLIFCYICYFELSIFSINLSYVIYSKSYIAIVHLINARLWIAIEIISR